MDLQPDRIAEQLAAARDEAARSRDDAEAAIAELEPLISRRHTFDLEVGAGLDPTLEPDDVEFVRNLRAGAGGHARNATWQLPSGLILTGTDVAEVARRLGLDPARDDQ